MKKNILIIRFSAMGDVAILATLLATVTRQYPEVQITVLTKKAFTPMFETLPNVSVYAADLKEKHDGIKGLYKLFKELKEQSFDAVLDMHYVLRTRIIGLFYKLLKSDIPFFHLDKGRKEKKALTRPKNKVFKQLKTSYERYADLFTKIGMPLQLSNDIFIPKPQQNVKAKDFISAIPYSTTIGIAPFAAHEGKMYPWEEMQKVIDLLATKEATLLLFGGGKEETEKLEKVAEKYSNVYNMAGKFSLSEELQLISSLNIMVAMDSGNAHLAAMYGVPTLTIWGVTHPYAGFYPYGQSSDNALLADREQYPLIPTSIYGNTYSEGYEKVMYTITPQSITSKVEKIVSSKQY